MPSPWDFGDVFVQTMENRRNRQFQQQQFQQQMAFQRELTMEQLAQKKREMDTLAQLKREAMEQDAMQSTRDYNLNVATSFVDDPAYTGPQRGSLTTGQYAESGQEGPVLGIGDTSRMTAAIGPERISLNQYNANAAYRKEQEGKRLVPTGDKAPYFGGRTEVPASEYTETLGAVGQMYVIDQAGRNALAALKAQAMRTGTLPRPYQNTTPEQRAALRALYQNQADQYRQQQNYAAAAEIDAMILGLQSEDVFSGTASGGGAPAPMLSEEDRAFLGQMSPAVHADDLLGEINKWDAVAQSDAYSAAERQAARARADSFRAERSRILARESGEITPVMDAYNSIGNQLPVFRGALEGALSASGSVQGNPAIMALVARARALRALREQQRTP